MIGEKKSNKKSGHNITQMLCDFEIADKNRGNKNLGVPDFIVEEDIESDLDNSSGSRMDMQ